jgi:tricorn protease
MKPDTSPAPYLRHPAIRGDAVVFVSDDDLWRVSAGGGTAVRLTAGLGEPATPVLSPDGRWIAYAGRDEQHSEVWLMPAEGGPARRLTWLASDLAVRGWAPDGRIVFCSNHGQPFLRNWQAWAIAPEGGVPERLPLGPAHHLAFGPGGRRVIGRNTEDPARWKRYRGGRAGHLWLEDAKDPGRFERLTQLAGNVTCPMWLGGRLYFIGDGEGFGNLYSVAADGQGLQRHTDHGAAGTPGFYARQAATDGARIVYVCGAELWLYDPAAGASRPVPVHVPSARTQAQRRHLAAAEPLQGLRLHPQGHSLALELRGQLHTLPLWEGAPQRWGGTARHRLGQWLADGRTLVAVADGHGEHGDERLVAFAPGEPAGRVLPWVPGRVTSLAASPAGSAVAFANHRNELWLGDVADPGTLRALDRSDFGVFEDLVFSPCGRWLAATAATSPRHTAIKLYETGGAQRSVVASQPGRGTDFRDRAPAFDPAGRHLYFLSLRTFDPVYDAVQFELSFPRAARPYLVALQADAAPPFEPAPRGMRPPRHGPEDGTPPAPPAAAPREIEPEGLADRIAAFPVAEGRFGRIAGVAAEGGSGKVVWTQLPLPGAHGRGGHKELPGRIEVFDFDSGEVATLAPAADDFVLAADHRTLVLNHAGQLVALDAGHDARPGDGARPIDPHAKPSRDSGVIDLARIKLQVNPPEEWAQMLREVWRLQRDQFWTEDMSGIDWPGVWTRYAALLPRVATRSELSDLIWELQGELGTSHAYEMGGDHRKPPATALGQLAAELAPREGGAAWEIVRIVGGDRWDASATSPLTAVGVQAQPGERIVAVGGRAPSLDEPPQALLIRQANAKVSLTLARPDGTRREVLVKALADEAPARYREWVETNRAFVHEASAGRCGYLHLPDMMSAGFAEFHRYFATECDRDALVVDLRYNRGGHVSQLLLEKVARRRIAWNRTRWGAPEPYPGEAAAGPVVALANEHSGSDGDIFSHNFKLMGLGPLVGTRTWGGVIGIWPRHRLADGTETTQPEYSFWFKDVGWAVENFGTEPTIPVDNKPEDDAHGPQGVQRDRQLRAALDAALAAIEAKGVARPDFGPRPVLAAPVLPPRRQN